MPPYRYLFQEVKKGSQEATNALPVNAKKEGHVVIPTPDAEKLVEYLLSLDRTSPLPEAGGAKPVAAAPAPEKK